LQAHRLIAIVQERKLLTESQRILMKESSLFLSGQRAAH